MRAALRPNHHLRMAAPTWCVLALGLGWASAALAHPPSVEAPHDPEGACGESVTVDHPDGAVDRRPCPGPASPPAEALPPLVEAAPLVPDAGPALETVVEVAAPLAAASSQSIEREALKDVNAKSAEDLLRRVPGVQVVQHGSEGKAPQLFLRGVDAVHGSDVEVTLDGLPLNEPLHVHGHGYLDLAFIIPELVDRLDVDKGAFRLRQGPFATAGSLHYRLRARPGIEVVSAAGAPLRARAAVVAAQSARRFVAVEGVRSAGFGEGRAVSRGSLNAAYTLQLLPTLLVEASVFAGAARFGLPGAVRRDDVQRGTLGLRDSYQPGQGQSARLLSNVGARLRFGQVTASAQAWLGLKHVQLVENFTGWLSDAARSDALLQRQEHVDVGARSEGEWKLHRTVRLTVLAQARSVAGDQRQSHPAVGALEEEELQHDLFVISQAALGGAAVWQPSRWLRANVGLRADGFQTLRTPAAIAGTGAAPTVNAWGAALSPRVSVSASPFISGLRTFISFGRGVRPPTNADDGSSAILDAVMGRWGAVHTAEMAEVGATWRTETLTLAASAFGTLSTGEVLFDHVARTTTTVGASRRVGLEGRAAWSFGRWVELSGDVTLVDARLTHTGDVTKLSAADLLGGDAVPGVPNVSGALRSALTPWDGLRLGLSAVGLGPRPLRYGAVADPVALVNGFVRYRLGNVELELAGDNLLDVDYAEGAGMFASSWANAGGRGSGSQLPTQHLYAGGPRLVRLGVSVDL